MTISQIKNPWIRKPLVAVLAPLLFLLLPGAKSVTWAVVRLMDAVIVEALDAADTVAAAWRGE